MTENKRYTVIHLGNPVDCVIKDHTSDNTIGIFSSMHNPVNEVCDLLNNQDNRIKELETQIKPIKDICKKYQIPIKDLPEVLEEYIATDNEEYLEKLKNQ